MGTSSLRALVRLLALLALLASLPSQGADETAAGGTSAGIGAPIAVESDSGTDARIRARVEQLFATLDGLRNVRVEVNAGVVALSGEVSSRAEHEQALQLARRVENVVEVRDRITESRDLHLRLAQMGERVYAQLVDFVAYLPLLIVAGIVLALFWWLSKLVSGSERIARRFGDNPFLREFARQIIRVGVVAVGVLFALQILDASTVAGSVLGAAGVIGLAVGFALRDTVENYIASLLLSLRQPFARDDLVTIDGCEGRVVRLTARATILMTPDGNHTRIPNARVYKAVIVNYTRNPTRRFQFDVGVDTEQNLAAAQELAAATLAQMDGVLADPPPSCTVEQLGESNVVLRVFGWVDQTQAEYVKVRSEAIRLVKGAFDRAGVVMPEPIYNVRVGQLPGAPGSAPSAAAHADQRTAQRAESPRSKTEQISPEPVRAIDIARRDDLGEQIAADRGADDQDLLRSHAPKE
jgi:small-conductance mechanosensitive channel